MQDFRVERMNWSIENVPSAAFCQRGEGAYRIVGKMFESAGQAEGRRDNERRIHILTPPRTDQSVAVLRMLECHVVVQLCAHGMANADDFVVSSNRTVLAG